MNYYNQEIFTQAVTNNKDYQEMIETMKSEVESFGSTFHDDVTAVSRWGHHYFCKEDGGLLIYDINKPKEHVCSICGTSYSNDLLNGVWVTMYRNQAVVVAWESALLYQVTGEKKYIDTLVKIIGFYADNYLDFELHNKEGLHYKTLEEMKWGCGRIMPQGLNESIWMIRMINALELVKESLDTKFMDSVTKMCESMFVMVQPQVDKVHNISCWYNSAVGTMGLFLGNKDMVDFAFAGPFNIGKQLREGVTADGFWYEGSIHYNFFTLEGITNLLLFSRLYDHTFGEEEAIIEKMFDSAYKYAFDNHQLPNPNDGWPNVNLKTYSYIYCVAAKVFGIDSPVGNLLKSLLSKDVERGTVPLSKPYYYDNRISLERLVLIPEIDLSNKTDVQAESVLFDTSHMMLLKNDQLNVFYKFGHNGPSHAHPDKMTLEVIADGACITRDLSNSGYGNALCNEWHRMSVSHNTVVANGENHTSTGPGICKSFSADAAEAEALNVYEGIDYKRKLQLTQDGFDDIFTVTSNKKNHYDYFFHVEGDLMTSCDLKDAQLSYRAKGYQHIHDVKQVITDSNTVTLEWQVDDVIMACEIDLADKSLFLGETPDNPVSKTRRTMIITAEDQNVTFNIRWNIRRL